MQTCKNEVLEWIPYDGIKNIEYLAEGGFGVVYKARWIDGNIGKWSITQNRWSRIFNTDIVLKCLNNSQSLTTDFLQEARTVIFAIYHLNIYVKLK